jgi:hypothetical protein
VHPEIGTIKPKPAKAGTDPRVYPKIGTINPSRRKPAWGGAAGECRNKFQGETLRGFPHLLLNNEK